MGVSVLDEDIADGTGPVGIGREGRLRLSGWSRMRFERI